MNTPTMQIKPATQEIPLTKGMVAVVDEADAPLVLGHKWYAMKGRDTYYAATNAPMRNGVRGKTIMMHRLILGEAITDADLVDHEDGNGLNNQRSNIRRANKSLNSVNSKRSGSSSKFRGVTWDKKRSKWAVYIKIGGKSKNLGRFNTEREAASAYELVAKPIYGEFYKSI